MDLGTLIGIVVLIAYGFISRQFSSSLINGHAVFVVLGGTLVALFINAKKSMIDVQEETMKYGSPATVAAATAYTVSPPAPEGGKA